MAYSVSSAMSTGNATPKIGMPSRVTCTITNAGTIPITIDRVQFYFVNPASKGCAGNLGKVAGTTSMVAGSVTPPTATTITETGGSAATAIFSVNCVLHSAMAATINCVCYGYRSDTGSEITVVGSSAVTVTAS